MLVMTTSYSRKIFARILDEKCKNMYNFLYLPMDQKTNCNMGYGYVNMVDLDAVCVLYDNVFPFAKWCLLSLTIIVGRILGVKRSARSVTDVCRAILFRNGELFTYRRI